MGFRFRKSVNLGPLRLNFSKSGIGYSFGGKFARYTKKANGGTRTTYNIPGTGVSYVKDYGAKEKASSSKASSSPARSTVTGAPPSGTKGTGTPVWKKPWFIAVVAVLVLAGAGSYLSDSGEDASDEPQQVEETLPSEADAQDAPEAVLEDEEEPEDQEPVQEPAEAPESAQEAPEVQDPAPVPETPASEPQAPAEPVSDPQPEPEPEPDPEPAPVVTPAPEPEPDPEPAQETGRTVYITPTGSKYHYDNNCNGGTYIASTLDEAKSLGLEPCKKCAGG